MQQFSLVYNNLFVSLEPVDEPRPTYACGQLMQGTASRRNLAQLGHKDLIFAYFKCSFVDLFLLKYKLTQAQVIKLLY